MPSHRKPANEPPKMTYPDLIQDAAWLADELESLKRMLPEIPYAERPMGQESMMDILARIGKAHDEFFKPLFLSLQKGEVREVSELSINFENRSKNVTTPEEDPQKLLNELISQRLFIVELLEQLDESAIHSSVSFKDGEKDVYSLINRMILFDRNQLKQIAERMLSVDADRHSPAGR